MRCEMAASISGFAGFTAIRIPLCPNEESLLTLIVAPGMMFCAPLNEREALIKRRDSSESNWIVDRRMAISFRVWIGNLVGVPCDGSGPRLPLAVNFFR